MKNYGLIKYLNADITNFTSVKGIKRRQKIAGALKKLLIIATKEKIVVENYPELEKNEPYIFVATHGFTNDAIASLATIDRNAYLLMGTTDQVEHNPLMNFAWLNGFIYVNRTDDESRKSAVDKMEFVIRNGSSVILYPEGGFNNTENKLINRPFAGAYLLAKRTGAKVVPIAPFYEYGSDTIYMNYGEPMNLSMYDTKQEAIQVLADVLATMVWANLENHSTRLTRADLTGDIHMTFMEERRQEYLKSSWTRDVWEEELTVYKDKRFPCPEDVWKTFEKVNITSKKANIIAPILRLNEEYKKYDFKKYMHLNWNKPYDKGRKGKKTI